MRSPLWMRRICRWLRTLKMDMVLPPRPLPKRYGWLRNAPDWWGSIEDASGDPAHPIYEFDHAVERVAAAAAAAHALPFPFMLVARAENYLHGRQDLDDTIRRLQAYEASGAEVLYAPGITQPDEIRTVCASVKKPVNVLMGLKGAPRLTVRELGSLGVRRVSIGSGFCRAALTAFLHAAREVRDDGTFTFADEALYMSELVELFGRSDGE